MGDRALPNLPEEIADLLVRIRVTLLNREQIDCDVRPLTTISYDHLEQQLEETPSEYSFWGMVHAEQEAVVAILDLQCKKRKAELAEALMEKGRAEGGVIPRRSDINDFADDDKTLMKLRAKMILERRSLQKLNVLMEAMKMKSEHLRSLSGFKKQEMRDSG